MEKPTNKVVFHSFESIQLEQVLGIKAPASEQESLRQLHYVERYVRDHVLGCRSIAIEGHYIDRDYMEDHSVFYSRNLYPYEN